jgi:exodeoxyribonuclease VII large subunit
MALQTSPESPVPVRRIAQLIGEWIGRLGKVWVEGQLTQVNRRPGTSVVFITLRDPSAEVSISVTCPRRVFDEAAPGLADGARVVVLGRPVFYLARGTLSLAAEQIRPVGVGELLARLEHLKRVLTAEGLFDPARKRALPFLPGAIGLVCGRGSAAERDVLENARRRWPAVRFRVEAVAVQGPYAVAQVTAAVEALDADPAIEVIIVARGGGSVEDLLPFSDETLLRAVSRCRTPVVSAIGHEPDSPLLDLVADLRASTPTDAAKKVVPDVGEELTRVRQLRERAHRIVTLRLEREQAGLDAVRSRPVLAKPLAALDRRADELTACLTAARRVIGHRLDRAADECAHLRARLRALSPASTLRRGYAIVQRTDGSVLFEAAKAAPGEHLAVRLAEGRLAVTAQGPID